MNRLNQYRNKIDSIDERLLKLLNQRAKVVRHIQKLKAKNKLRTYDRKREKEILQRLSALNQGPLSEQEIQNLFRHIIGFFRKKQKSQMPKLSTRSPKKRKGN